MDLNLDKFGARLRGLIVSHGLTNDDVIRRLQISRATLFNWFNRDRPPPSSSHQDKLVALFGESRDYVLYGRPESRQISRPVTVTERTGGDYLGEPFVALERQIRSEIDTLIIAANKNLGRLGWLLEEVSAIRREKSDWIENDEQQMTKDHERAIRSVISEEKKRGA